MSKIPVARPPRKPRGESAKVTIGNLERQRAELMTRVENLVASRDSATRDRLVMERERDTAQRELATEKMWRNGDVHRLEECQAKLASTEQRFQGYQAAVMDMARPKPLIIGHNGMPLDLK